MPDRPEDRPDDPGRRDQPGQATQRSDLTASQEAEVRRRLAEARHTEPLPADVAQRLDRVLAGLSAEPVRKATVVRLADRRRKAAALLAAAAAVVVGGVAVGQWIGGNGSDQASTTADSGGAAESGAAPDRRPERDEGAESDTPGRVADEGTAELTIKRGRPLPVRPRTFAEDAARLQMRQLGSAKSYSQRDGTRADRRNRFATDCQPGDWGPGVYQPVRYGRAPGYVVFRDPQGDSQVADLFLCGVDRAVRSVTLPAR